MGNYECLNTSFADYPEKWRSFFNESWLIWFCLVSTKENKSLKLCPKCSGNLALLYKERKRSENTYSPDRMHNLVCVNCGYSRTERFGDRKKYPYLVIQDGEHGLKVIDNTGKDSLERPMDATTIGIME